MRLGKFITIEGFLGSGKTCTVNKLRKQFPDAVFIREPGHTPGGKEIKRIISSKLWEVEKRTEDILYLASFLETSAKVIFPALEQGKLVFSERWYYSTKAFQLFPYGIDFSFSDILSDRLGVCHPDINIILHSPYEVCLSRVEGMRRKQRIVSKGEEYLRRVLTYYSTECPGISINSNRDVSSIVNDITMIVGYGE